MNVRPDDNCPHRFIVSSESDGDKEYTVELYEYPLGLNAHGDMMFNGACGIGKERFNGCRNFIFSKEPHLRKMDNFGNVYRCKHIVAARDYLAEMAIDRLIPALVKMDPNLKEEHMT